jgi:hypothetical protein
MPKVSTQVQRRIAELDAKYTVAQPKRSGFRVVALILLALMGVAAFYIAKETPTTTTRKPTASTQHPSGWGPTINPS